MSSNIRDKKWFQNRQNSYLTCFLLAVSVIVIKTKLTTAWVTEGLCAEPLGFAVNNFLDGCMRGHHYFSAMRSYSLKNLYKINCCPGYKVVPSRGRDSELMCQATCALPCINGVCIKPDTCQCNVGHYLKGRYECRPTCHPSCRNGLCVGVDECMCNPGYRFVNGSKTDCEAICECHNGRCKGPGLCECFEGFKMEPGSNWNCVPHCDIPCTNGVCSSPNFCNCSSGYSKVESNNCEPLCRSGCGVGYCSSPDMCTCPAGYITLPGQTCKPICEGCFEGTCVSPGVCHCPNGRTLDKTDKCIQICNPPCVNGDCIDGICVCKKGFIMINESGICEPVCRSACINGHCINPDQCECLNGYKVSPYSKTECEAICTNPCVNGTCVAPEICQCWEGFAKVSNSCNPICKKGCGLGTCTSPNSCSCPEGYEAIEGGSCQPACQESCDNGFCVEPNVCVCPRGYWLDETSGNCEAEAETCKDCVNGLCISSHICKCLPNHNKRPDESFFCLPELGELSSKNSTSFLNFFHISSVIGYLEDNETFAFTKLPSLIVKKNCNFLFNITNLTTNITDLSIPYVELICDQIVTDLELNIHLYCHWPEESSEINPHVNSSFTDQNITFTKWQGNNLWNFSLHLEFPESFKDGEDGFCTMCIQPTIGSKYFSLIGLDVLHLSPCNQDTLVGISSALHDELPILWIALGSSLVIVLIILLAGVTIFIVKSSKWNHFYKTNEPDEIKHCNQQRVSLLLKEQFLNEDNNTLNRNTEC